MSQNVLKLPNSPVTNLQVNDNSKMNYLDLLVEQTLIMLVCSVVLFKCSLDNCGRSYHKQNSYYSSFANDLFSLIVEICDNCFPFSDCHLFRAYLVKEWEFLLDLLNLTPSIDLHRVAFQS